MLRNSTMAFLRDASVPILSSLIPRKTMFFDHHSCSFNSQTSMVSTFFSWFITCIIYEFDNTTPPHTSAHDLLCIHFSSHLHPTSLCSWTKRGSVACKRRGKKTIDSHRTLPKNKQISEWPTRDEKGVHPSRDESSSGAQRARRRADEYLQINGSKSIFPMQGNFRNNPFRVIHLFSFFFTLAYMPLRLFHYLYSPDASEGFSFYSPRFLERISGESPV